MKGYAWQWKLDADWAIPEIIHTPQDDNSKFQNGYGNSQAVFDKIVWEFPWHFFFLSSLGVCDQGEQKWKKVTFLLKWMGIPKHSKVKSSKVMGFPRVIFG